MSPRNCWTQTKADGVAMTGKLDSPASEAAAPSSARRTVTVSNQKGLHARAAAKFVKLAEQFDAQVTVEKSDTRVPGCSIMGRSEEHTSELQSLMRTSYAVFC